MPTECWLVLHHHNARSMNVAVGPQSGKMISLSLSRVPSVRTRARAAPPSAKEREDLSSKIYLLHSFSGLHLLFSERARSNSFACFLYQSAFVFPRIHIDREGDFPKLIEGLRQGRTCSEYNRNELSALMQGINYKSMFLAA